MYNYNKINPDKYYILMKKLSQLTDFGITHFALNLYENQIDDECAGTLG